MILQEHLQVMAEAPPGSPAWLEARRHGVGASEVAAILGLPTYQNRGPLDIWLAKMGKDLGAPSSEESGWSISGRFAEPMIAARYKHERSVDGEEVELFHSATKVDSVLPYLFATPDRDVYPLGLPASAVLSGAPLRTLEIKNRNEYVRDQWGAAGTDEIPLDVLSQVQTQLGVHGVGEAHVAVLIGGWDFRIYVVHFDPDFFKLVREAVQTFWETYVLPGKEPPLAGARALEYVKNKWRRQLTQELRKPEPTVADWMHRCWAAKQAEKEQRATAEELQAFICDAIGTAGGFADDAFKATWNAGKDVTKIDREAIIAAILREVQEPESREKVEAIIAEFTEVVPASRRFLLSPVKPARKK